MSRPSQFLCLVFCAVALFVRAATAQCVRFASQCPEATTLVSRNPCTLRFRSFRRRCDNFGCVIEPVVTTRRGVRCIVPATVAPSSIVRATVPSSSSSTAATQQPASAPETIPILPPEDSVVPVLPPRPGAQSGECVSDCRTSFTDVSVSCTLAACKVVICSSSGSTGIGYNCVPSSSPGQAVLPASPVDILPAASTEAPATSSMSSAITESQTSTESSTASTLVTSSTTASTAPTVDTVAPAATVATAATAATDATIGTASTDATVATEATSPTADITAAPPVLIQPSGVPDYYSGGGSQGSDSAPTEIAPPGITGTVYYAGYGTVTQCVNGEVIGQVSASTPVQTVWADSVLNEGDVVALGADASGTTDFGVVNAYLRDGAWTSAGSTETGGEWRAIRAGQYFDNQDLWKLPEYDACGWAEPDVLTRDISLATEFPPMAMASFVFAESSNQAHGVFLRHVVGRTCPPTTDTATASIAFAGDSGVSLFVNGQLRSRTFEGSALRYFNLPLSDGDVLAFEAENADGAPFGVIAALKKDGAWKSTGGPGASEWRAIRDATYTGAKDAWKTTDYNACCWPPASTDTDGISTAVSGFPSDAGADYVWALDGNSGTSLTLMRHVVGESCPTQSGSMHFIEFAGIDEVEFYINAEFAGGTASFSTLSQCSRELNTGDVLAFKGIATGTAAHGMLAGVIGSDADPGTKATGTATNGEWRAIAALDFNDGDAWMTGEYDACGWPAPTTLTSSNTGSSTVTDTIVSGADYVWSRGAGPSGDTLLRHIVGLSCPLATSTAEIAFAAPSKITLFVNGQFRSVLYPPTGSVAFFSQFFLQLTAEDVVAFEVAPNSGGNFGMIAAFRTDSSSPWTSTGGDTSKTGGEWRATKASSVPTGTDWTAKSFDACGWSSIVAQASGNVGDNADGRAVNFPYTDTGAWYSWADGATDADRIYVRRVVGGTCSPEL